ncbi:MAG: TonB-dependent receptor [Tenuifilaceae bacterium]|jgi:hypothetical protein|nr:TonB-dependent receptor [Tenuifilaceae bacterium]
MKKYILSFITLIAFPFLLLAQESGTIQGRVYNKKNNEPIPFANIVVWNTTIGSTSDFDGKFSFSGLKPGFVELRVSAIGFETFISSAVMVTNARTAYIDIAMDETSVQIDAVTVTASPFRKSEESPVSLRRIGIDEIEKNPGGNRDISRVIQSLPGVASTPAYRNDVIVRGGGASENRFYLDGVEIPNLNHFATQGASGGPVGIINVDFVREVNFYSGAFPASKGNATSSVLDFRLIDGNMDRLKIKGAVGASDLALTLDGPMGDKSSFIFSARRSYLQFLFDALGLPFLPTYNDFQFKTKTKIDDKNEITVVGLGAIDEFSLNTGLENPDEGQQYILNYVPVNTQWNYTLGVVYKHYYSNGFDTWVVSRNMLNNRQYKYRDNNKADIKLLDYTSQEIENKFRYERDIRTESNYKLNYGAGFEYARYLNDTYRATFTGGSLGNETYSTNLDLFKWNAFGQVSRDFFNKKLSLSLGIRTDANSYSSSMSNMFEQISPRFSAAYQFMPNMYLNFNVGRYYQQPAYTMLGYKDELGALVNKTNKLKYIQSDHIVAGIEWQPNEASKFTIEGFYKIYNRYPFSVTDSISLASKGADFGTFGDEEVISTGKGNAYGAEVLYRNKDFKGVNLILSYTLVWSNTKAADKNLQPISKAIPTAWDNRHILTVTATRSFKRNWDIGAKWRFVGGAPYTPYDMDKSTLIEAFDAQGRAYLDYGRYNSLRLGSFHQLDVRVDKMYYLKNWTLNFYIDIQNIYGFKSDEADRLIPVVDENGNRVVDPNDPQRYILKKVENDGGGTILPTIGIIVEF